MNFLEEKSQFSHILYFLENEKIPDLIRVMFSRKVSEDYLRSYGYPAAPQLHKNEQARIEDYLKKFNVKEVLLRLEKDHTLERVTFTQNTISYRNFPTIVLQTQTTTRRALHPLGQANSTPATHLILPTTKSIQIPSLTRAAFHYPVINSKRRKPYISEWRYGQRFGLVIKIKKAGMYAMEVE